ncbi:zinc ABC transporter substrate-binding protein ZnuA [Pseudomonas sp. ABC1]|uniref:zinc ABC transporter substrate-binding protein ZnuA n=1 Tax=Pseudomonas sp. ABC1 TaxID=2748080 RepID=UPI0015C3A821|nr:zinc ABC transporter substrate-binding protein ZnuA [Pseudomonas sp. ABC1]QLF93618.1 zinc ABC transporter substrate-binding protein ZnuA [Pseudomonas sp. ABC1]
MRSLITLLCLLAATQVRADVQVLTSIKPLQLIAAAVLGDTGQPDVLLPPGASPHHYALRPSDIRRLRDADLLYWIGPDMENFLARPLASRDGQSLALQTLPGLHLRHYGDEHEHEHEHEHSHDHGHDETGQHDHEHRPGSLDAHLWLQPANARVIAQRIANDLANLDATNAQRYRDNAKAFSARLDGLDQSLRGRLSSLAGKPYFVFHDTYGYFESAYGLDHTGVFSVSADVQPGARHVAQMREQLKQAGPSCIFSEPPLQPRLAQTLSADLPVKLAELDALGADIPVSATGYEQLLKGLADALENCLK